MSELRLICYLAPSLPHGLFEIVAARIAEATGLATSLRFETRTSAPPRGEVDPFSAGEADIGFLCSPGYVWLTELAPPAVRLLAAAPVFDHPRGGGRPVYFSDVVVASGSRATRLEDLRGATWAFNDRCSWSGYLSLVRRLRSAGGMPFVRVLRESGSHLESIRLVAAGEVDAAAIDSNALALLLRREPALAGRLRIVESWGPHPVQPVVVTSRMPEPLADRIAVALRSMHLDHRLAEILHSFGVKRFAPISDNDYASERSALRAWDRGPKEADCVDQASWA